MLKIKITASVLLSSIVITTMSTSQVTYQFNSFFVLMFTHVFTEWMTKLAQKRTARIKAGDSSLAGKLSQCEHAFRGQKSGIHQLLMESALLSFQTAEFSRVSLLLKQHCSLVCINLWFERNALVH